jgi:type II secretion system protein G
MLTQKPLTGFTLIELLVVIAIIGVLASVVMVALNSSRAKGRDAVRQTELRQLETALNMYYSQNGSFPANPVPGSGVNSASAHWTTIWQPLVDAGFLPTIPKGPTGNDYAYYNYGPNNTRGALLVTTLESTEPSTGYPGTCRPFSGSNWCRGDVLSRYYCLCTLY